MARSTLARKRARRRGRDIHVVMDQMHDAGAGADQTAQAGTSRPGGGDRRGDRRALPDLQQARCNPPVGAQIEVHAWQKNAIEEALEQGRQIEVPHRKAEHQRLGR